MSLSGDSRGIANLKAHVRARPSDGGATRPNTARNSIRQNQNPAQVRLL